MSDEIEAATKRSLRRAMRTVAVILVSVCAVPILVGSWIEAEVLYWMWPIAVVCCITEIGLVATYFCQAKRPSGE
jgi:membrane protein YdbS with pleckstrin-like domain